MRLSRDKVNKLAHVVADAVADMDEVEFIEDRNTVRLEVRKILEELLMQEARLDQSARQKIESQRRTIIEGSEEAVTAALLKLGSAGNVRSQTLRAFSQDEFSRLLKKVP